MDGRIHSVLLTQLRRAQKREVGLKNLLGETEAELQVSRLFDSVLIWNRNLTLLKLKCSTPKTNITFELAPSLLGYTFVTCILIFLCRRVQLLRNL